MDNYGHLSIRPRRQRKYRLSKSRAIAQFCLGCAGDSAKEVTLCHSFDCPLWEWRTGGHVSNAGYKRRMATALKNHSDELAELSAMGVEIAHFQP